MKADTVSDELWMPACYGAALGDVAPVQNYCSTGGFQDRRVSNEESKAMGEAGIWGTAGATMLEIAMDREHRDVIAFLTDGVTLGGSAHGGLIRHQMSSLMGEVQRTTSFARRFGDVDEETIKELPDEVRAILFSTIHKRNDGLTFLAMPRSPCSRSLFMPKEIATTDAGSRGRALGLLIEAKDCLDALETAVGWWPDCGAAQTVPLYTSADLNCLLHACSLALAGVRDSMEMPGAEERCLLRDAMYTSLAECQRLREAIQDPTRSVKAGENQARVDEVVSLARKNRVALDGAHIFVLSNVLRRPIICHAPPDVEGGESRHALTVPFRMSGIYLPLLWDAAETSPDPLVIVYTRGHFTALSPVEPLTGSGVVAIPLYDSQRASLPVPYAAIASGNSDCWIGWAGLPPAHAGKAEELMVDISSRDCRDVLERYLTVTSNAHGLSAAMRVPAPELADKSGATINTDDILEFYVQVLQKSIRKKLAECHDVVTI